MSDSSHPRRRWLRFSLRTLLAAMTALCIVGGWVAYQLHWIRERHAVLANHPNAAFLDAVGSSQTVANAGGTSTVWVWDDSQPPAPWPLRWFGEEGHSILVFHLPESDPELARIRKLFPEAEVTAQSDGRVR